MSFILIEGDNGTGKDTLFKYLKLNNYINISYLPEIKLIENNAKISSKKIKAFFEYNNTCSKYVEKYKFSYKNVILIRYWISSLAAAYADNIYDREKIISMTHKFNIKLTKPDIVICLNCDFKKRIARILNRNLDCDDNIQLERSKKYYEILQVIKLHTNTKWIDIDTTEKLPEQIKNEVEILLESSI